MTNQLACRGCCHVQTMQAPSPVDVNLPTRKRGVSVSFHTAATFAGLSSMSV